MVTSERLSKINEYYFSTKLQEIDNLRKQGKEIISLAIGSPDLPPHPEVIKVLSTESSNPKQHGYQSYRGSLVLREAFSKFYSKYYGVSLDPESEILPLIGSKEGIFHICMSFLNPGDKVLLPSLGYPTYRAAVELSGGIPVFFEMNEKYNYFPDFAALAKTDLSGVKLMWVNYPNMPTGQMPSKQLFTDLVRFGIKNNILICHDNPYSFILNDNPMSILEIPGAMETAIELNSLSKSHNMAGWRIGMIAARKEIATEVLKFKSNIDTGMFYPSQLAAVKALSLGKEWFASLNSEYAQRRILAQQFMQIINCSYNLEHSGMFVWAKIPDSIENSYVLADKILHTAGIFITPGGVFGDDGKRYLRISLCAPIGAYNKALERIQGIQW